eukprot:TRINITY_DN4341_c0_g1_i5.p2 TRINITY_DN4341_c0_g1~~TRINITY_DN4341_c0_g1_i5.p2  ORF type:complete len:251 (+),score=30.61 TRINITY_DN4341_c0_g1_i5:78-830(+)
MNIQTNMVENNGPGNMLMKRQKMVEDRSQRQWYQQNVSSSERIKEENQDVGNKQIIDELFEEDTDVEETTQIEQRDKAVSQKPSGQIKRSWMSHQSPGQDQAVTYSSMQQAKKQKICQENTTYSCQSFVEDVQLSNQQERRSSELAYVGKCDDVKFKCPLLRLVQTFQVNPSQPQNEIQQKEKQEDSVQDMLSGNIATSSSQDIISQGRRLSWASDDQLQCVRYFYKYDPACNVKFDMEKIGYSKESKIC